ncbi:hypothetical protein DM860_011973 [Cuscuta australis]|uniref:Uncharacterized protein n=1 Tax=Cuscuta australis TaxID=267555 RepID=A0A328DAI7_9ASTE|nr:hypothetical protein DM860_011973 [Cuscuta australis]
MWQHKRKAYVTNGDTLCANVITIGERQNTWNGLCQKLKISIALHYEQGLDGNESILWRWLLGSSRLDAERFSRVLPSTPQETKPGWSAWI